MYFVKNVINKFSRKKTKEAIPKRIIENHWDKKHILTGTELCKFRGHLWKSERENGRKKAVCIREGCFAEFWVDSQGVI